MTETVPGGQFERAGCRLKAPKDRENLGRKKKDRLSGAVSPTQQRIKGKKEAEAAAEERSIVGGGSRGRKTKTA